MFIHSKASFCDVNSLEQISFVMNDTVRNDRISLECCCLLGAIRSWGSQVQVVWIRFGVSNCH